MVVAVAVAFGGAGASIRSTRIRVQAVVAFVVLGFAVLVERGGQT